MTVRELIEQLRFWPDDRLVVVEYDGNLWPAERVTLQTVDVVMGENVGENDVSMEAVVID